VAKSQGIAFNKSIKNKFAYTKVASDMDISAILETIEDLKQNKQ
jgi:hypothetical protein